MIIDRGEQGVWYRCDQCSLEAPSVFAELRNNRRTALMPPDWEHVTIHKRSGLCVDRHACSPDCASQLKARIR